MAALICHRLDAPTEFTRWRDRAEAAAALAQLATPRCGPRCIGVHTVVAVEVEPPRPRGRHLSRFLA